MKRIETDRLFIRPFILSDAKAAHELFSDGEAMRFLALFPPLITMDESIERTKKWSKDGRHFATVKKVTDEFIGYISINPDSEDNREDTKEIGFAILNKHRRNGYMKETVRAVLNELRKDGICYVWACCFKNNDSSEQLIKGLGFEFMNGGQYLIDNDQIVDTLEFRIEL